MDGFALCRKWKQDERLQSIPFLFYTRRHDDPKYERFALELGAERFLARSVPPETLVRGARRAAGERAEEQRRHGDTMPLPTLDETVIQRAVGLDKAQRAAEAEKVQRIAELENAQRKHAPNGDAEGPSAAQAGAELESAQRKQAAELENVQRKQAAELESAQRKQAEAAERAQQAQARLRAQIEELEATNQRLAAGEARFRRVFEANPLPMWIADHATGGFIAVNEAALALYGYSAPSSSGSRRRARSARRRGRCRADRASAQGRRRAQVCRCASQEIEFDGRSADLVSALRPDRAHAPSTSCARSGKLRERSGQRPHAGRSGARTAAGFSTATAGCSTSTLRTAACPATAAKSCSDERLADRRSEHRRDDDAPAARPRARAADATKPSIAARTARCIDVEVSVGMLENARGDSIVLIRDVSQRRRETGRRSAPASVSSNSSSTCSSRPRASTSPRSCAA